MKLLKTTFFSAIITIIRIASGLVGGKVIAVYTGPAGVALVAAFNNFIAIVLTFANGAINTGVVKYTAEYKNEENKLKALFSTALKISVSCSAIIGSLLLLMAPYFSTWLFASEVYTNPLRILGLTIILYALNSLLVSILNGKGQIKTYTIVNVIGNVIGLIVTIVLSYFYGISGALYALVLAQSLVFFVTAALIIKSPWFSRDYFTKAFDKRVAIKLTRYSLMAIVSALTIPVSQIILRNMLIAKTGIDAAGYWQGMSRISDGYLLLITTSLSTYYLPKLSSLKTADELQKEVFSGYKLILPFVLISCIIIYLFRHAIIRLLFTPDFMDMQYLFSWQLTGDFFKMAAWMLGYLMIAKAMTKTYIITEIIFSLSYVILGFIAVDIWGLKGASIAFAVNYLLYLIVMVVIFKTLIFKKNG